MIWEYLIIKASAIERLADETDRFNELGSDRWEHTASCPIHNGSGHHEFTFHYFKRRKVRFFTSAGCPVYEGGE